MRRIALSLMLLSAFPAAAGAYQQKWRGVVFARTGGRAPVVLKLDAVDVPAQPVQCRDAFGPISVMSPAHIELTGTFHRKGNGLKADDFPREKRGTVLRVRVFPPASYPPITDGGCSPSSGLLLDGGVQFGTDALCYVWGN